MQLEPVLAGLPPAAYSALPYAIAPVVGNPIAMAMRRLSPDTTLLDTPGLLGEALADMLPLLGALGEVLPQDTLLWKLKLLDSGCGYMNTRYQNVCACFPSSF